MINNQVSLGFKFLSLGKQLSFGAIYRTGIINMIKLSTEVALAESHIKLSYRQKSMMMGSCFAESVGTKLQELCFKKV